MLVVGMFDDEDALEEGMSRLSDLGLGDQVRRYEGPQGPTTPGSAGASEGGAQPMDMGRGFETSSPWPGQTRTSENRGLGGNELEAEEQEYYDRVLSEGGHLLMVHVDGDRGNDVTAALEQAGASRVATHHR